MHAAVICDAEAMRWERKSDGQNVRESERSNFMLETAALRSMRSASCESIESRAGASSRRYAVISIGARRMQGTAAEFNE